MTGVAEGRTQDSSAGQVAAIVIALIAIAIIVLLIMLIILLALWNRSVQIHPDTPSHRAPSSHHTSHNHTINQKQL